MSALQRTLLCCLALAPVCFTGCLGFGAKNKPKESTAIASEVEESFKQRWIEKRGAALMAQGISPDVARTQAIEEFKLNYGYTSAANK